MGKEMVVSADRHETRVALIEDDQLVEVFFQRAQEYSLAGSIHKGRVTRVLPGMQSAFVNLGLERDTFLYVSDFFEENEEFAEEKARPVSAGEGGERPERSERLERSERPERSDRGDRGGRDRGRRDGRYQGRPAAAAPTFALPATEGAVDERPEVPFSGPPFSVAPIVATQAANLAASQDAQSEEERRRRRRRGRGRSGFPDSKFGSPVTSEEDLAAVGEEPGELEVAQAPASEVILLPGESLRKYSQLKAAPRDETAMAKLPLRFLDDASMPTKTPEPTYVEVEASPEPDDEPESEEIVVIDTGLSDPEAALDEIQELAEAALERDAELVEPVTAPLALRPDEADLDASPQAGPVDEDDDDEEEEEDEDDEPGEGEAAAEGLEPPLPLAGFSAHVRAPEQGRFLQQRPPAAGAGRRGRRRGRRGRGDRPVVVGEVVPTVAPSPVSGAEEPHAPRLQVAYAEGPVGDANGAAVAFEPAARKDVTVEGVTVEGLSVEGVGMEGAPGAVVERLDAPAENRPPRGDRPERSGRGDRGGRGRGRDRGDRGADRPPAEARPAESREPRAERSGGQDRGQERGGDRQRPPLPSISDLLKEGQEILVQIAKEPLGQKGARITSHIALPGRYCVYMPTVNHTGVSRKIESDAERHRLKQILVANTEGMPGGFICRTAGEGRTEQDIAQDIAYLHSLWVEIKRKADAKPAPALLYHDVEIVERILRDQLTEDFKAIWIDSEEVYEQVLRFVQRLQPNLVNRVKLFTRPVPIFDFFNISAELEKALKPKVWLKSGGFIVINQTEALVAIDINTGKYVGKTNRLEDTIAKTNVEAVKEIVRQIRLRDLGGIIVIDFIDMDERKNRQKVMQALEDAMRVDKAPYKILQFNDFGLVAITRKRVKQSLERTLCMPCPHCEGAGYIKSVHTVIVEIVGEARKMARAFRDNKDVELRVHPDVAKELKSSGNSYLEEIEEIVGIPVAVVSDATIHHEKFSLA